MLGPAALIVETFPVGPLQCNCTILGDPSTGEAIVIDPGDEPLEILRRLTAHGLRPKAVLITHTHIDHVGGNHDVREQTGAKVMLHEKDLPLYDNLGLQAQLIGLDTPARGKVDEYIHQGDTILFGGQGDSIQVLHTPGHTPGSCSFFLPSRALLFSGDTLFRGSVGRTDLWGGDFDAEILSIREQLLPLPEHTRVIAGHGPDTTIAVERRSNPFLT
jgi:glyoxylase-like metal-dependent hydrolase (beta-lactamase superfamily II)